MHTKIFKGMLILLLLLLVLVNTLPAVAAGVGGRPELIIRDASPAIAAQIQATVPLSRQMVEDAIAVLSEGWSGMNQAERQEFSRFFDPAGTGGLDEDFMDTVLANYRLIRNAFDHRIVVLYEADSDICFGQQLYYTDFFRIHVCPYYAAETNPQRRARTFIHEIAHKALFVFDRAYYRPTNKRYAELTPRGSWTAQLPLVGPICREIARSDTLYHPDAYAHFALAMYQQCQDRPPTEGI